MKRIYRETRQVRLQSITWVGNEKVTTAPDRYVTVQIEIDIDALFSDVGEKAARSKGGKSVEAGGAVTAKRVQ